jgi:hypothetical protein
MTFSAIVSPASGDWGNIGVSVQTVDYGNFEGTEVDPNSPNGYIETGNFKPTALSAGVGYAIMLNDKFGVGGRVKYSRQSLGSNYFVSTAGDVSSKDNKAHAFSYDFGTMYSTGFRSITLGMSVTNFSSEVTYELEGFQLPLMFSIGLSADFFELVGSQQKNQQLLVAVDWTHPRSHPEQLHLGLEYQYMKILSLRAGYVSGADETKFSYGAGLASFGFAFDYSYIPFDILGKVQQFTVRFSM